MNFAEMESFDLFSGLNSGEISHICDCLNSEVRHYQRGDTVLFEGEVQKRFGVVIGGEARSYMTDVSGKEFMVSVIGRGGYIGILLAGLSNSRKLSPVGVRAADRLTVLFFPFDRIMRQCQRSCNAHSVFLANLIGGISSKAMFLYERIDCLIKPSVREKVLTYLSRIGESGVSFTIPFNREEMAEYLNVERSALSRELSRMKKDGVIDYKGKVFQIF